MIFCRRTNPTFRLSDQEIELDIFCKNLDAYESMYHRKESITLPTGEYSIDSFYQKNIDSTRATIYLKKVNNYTYKPDQLV